MEISADTIVSNAIGAVVAVLVALGYHIWARRDARQDFTVLTRFLESFSRALLEGNAVQVGFTRDAKGRVVNAAVSVGTKAVSAPMTARTGRLKGGNRVDDEDETSPEGQDLSDVSREDWDKILQKLDPDDFKYKM